MANRDISGVCVGKMSARDRFLFDFAAELDLFDSQTAFPAWVVSYRKTMIARITPVQKKLAKRLRDFGVAFKIKWPVKVDDKYKFADFYLPEHDAVIIVTPDYLNTSPMGLLSERARFFSYRFRTFEIDPRDGVDSIVRQLRQTVKA